MAQDNLSWLRENEIDSLYREDQFYVGFSFNFLTDLPSEVNQSGISGGLSVGFIRDIPFNKRRNISLGLGLGFNTNTYGQTLQIRRQNDTDSFEAISPDLRYDNNRFTTNLIELPIELRWRSSDVDKFSFWRVYLGLKFGYVFSSKSVFRSQEENYSFRSIQGITKLRSSASLTFGYGAVNFNILLALNSIFNDVRDAFGEEVNMRPVKVGLVFFFL